MASTIFRLASTSAHRAWIHEVDLLSNQLRVLESNTYHRAQPWESFHSSLGELRQKIEQLNTTQSCLEDDCQNQKEELEKLRESANRITALGQNIYWDDINKLT